ncbi:ATP-binding protein [Halopseudomonas xiamenensis]|uniref:ATP-binding protein n=1 Tax=Halopseudomonas xiamenensis TaxID=157792 RepID=UPI001C8A97C7|nr:ATP-binding protein [Halopseudomonas xiamenensis]
MSNLTPSKQQMSVDFSQKLVEASEKLVPWWSVDPNNVLKTETEKDPNSYLNSYYLFPLDEVSINADCDDIPGFINERFQNILAAASHSGFSVALVLSSRSGNNRIFLGLKDESGEKYGKETFESIVNGIFPGKNIRYDEATSISSLTEGCYYGGMVTGVPIVKIEDKKQKFNLSSVTRSLYGKDYLFAIISRPVSEQEKQSVFNELVQLRDDMHALAKRTLGENQSRAESETLTDSRSKTSGHSAGGTVGFGIPTPFGFIGVGGNYSHNWSDTEGNSKAHGRTDTFGNSLSFEQQNGYALELEKIADQYIERMIRGFAAGYWETSITFATQDKVTSDILAGTFVGELAKPGDKLLPPPRIYRDSLGDKALFIPKKSSANNLFPQSLASYITSEELALVSSPPVDSVPGYEIQRMPTLALTDIGGKQEIVLGCITDHGNPISGMHLHLSKNDLNKHLFVCGLTGSGKTTTVKHILKSLAQPKKSTPFLVLESAKRDYRQLLANDVFKNNLNIFTIGDATTSPIRFNPFYIQEGVHPLVHIDYLKAIFNASFSLYGPMPSIVEKCLHAIYIRKGWDLTLGTHPHFINSKGHLDEKKYKQEEHYYCFPTLTDLKNEVDHYIKNELDYQGELRDNIRTAIIVRLESLCVGAKGLMFNTHDFFPIEKLLSENTILEMESLADDDDKAFFVGLILVLLSEYRQKENPAVNPGMGNKGLRHFMVIEEAHRLLKNVETERTTEMMGNPKGKAVEVFCNILAEMRSLGQGVAVVEQIPSKISPDVIKNSNTKIVHRLVSKDDQSLLAGSLSIDDHEALYLNRLKTGHALCHKEGMARPVECVIQPNVSSHAISDEKVKRIMEPWTGKVLHCYQVYQIGDLLGQEGKELTVRLFNSLVTLESNELKKLMERAKEEIRKLLVLKKNRHQADESLFSDYFSLQIMLLLNKGIYCCRNPLPENFKSTLVQVMQQPNELARKSLIHALDKLWMHPSAKDFIEDIIETLVGRHIYNKERLMVDILEIKNHVSSFLLLADSNTLNVISKKIQNKMEAANA